MRSPPLPSCLLALSLALAFSPPLRATLEFETTEVTLQPALGEKTLRAEFNSGTPARCP
jgi:hypothetical protein